MKYVSLDARVGALTGVISPLAYLERLPALAEELPLGARVFATAEGHYDFHGQRCVKDLELEDVRFFDEGEVEVRFRHNCWKHDADLVIRYTGVSGFIVESPGGPSWTNLGTVILDEVLPHGHGCTHEVAFRPGSLHVTCRDLTASWFTADCPATT